MSVVAPESVQDAGTQAVAQLARDFVALQRRAREVVEFARAVGLDGDEVRMAFEREGPDFGDLLGVLEGQG